MSKIKKVCSFMLALAMAFCMCGGTMIASAAEAETPSVPAAVEPREILRYSYSQIITHASGNRAKITLNYTSRAETANASGEYITGILGGSAENNLGWTRVDPDIEITSIIYGNNHQTAAVGITYQASDGEGLKEYTAIVTIRLI